MQITSAQAAARWSLVAPTISRSEAHLAAALRHANRAKYPAGPGAPTLGATNDPQAVRVCWALTICDDWRDLRLVSPWPGTVNLRVPWRRATASQPRRAQGSRPVGGREGQCQPLGANTRRTCQRKVASRRRRPVPGPPGSWGSTYARHIESKGLRTGPCLGQGGDRALPGPEEATGLGGPDSEGDRHRRLGVVGPAAVRRLVMYVRQPVGAQGGTRDAELLSRT